MLNTKYLIQAKGLDWLDTPVLKIAVPALSGGTAGTHRCYCDYAGIFLWEKIEIFFGGVSVDKIDYWVAYQQVLQHLDKTRDYARVSTQLGGNLSDAQRTTLATAGAQTFFVDLSLFFHMFRAPLDLFSYEGKFEIVVTWKSSPLLIRRTDYTGSPSAASITSAQMLVSFIKPTSSTITGKQLQKQKDGGFVLPSVEYITVEDTYTCTGTSKQFKTKLENFEDKNITYINITVQLASNLTTNDGCDYTTFVAMDSYALKSPDGNYVDGLNFDTTDQYFRYYLLFFLWFLITSPLFGILGKSIYLIYPIIL